MTNKVIIFKQCGICEQYTTSQTKCAECGDITCADCCSKCAMAGVDRYVTHACIRCRGYEEDSLVGCVSCSPRTHNICESCVKKCLSCWSHCCDTCVAYCCSESRMCVGCASKCECCSAYICAYCCSSCKSCGVGLFCGNDEDCNDVEKGCSKCRS